MKIFVGIPMHNAAECVIQAFEHMTAETERIGAAWELMIFDDGSEPEQVDLVRSALADHRVQWANVSGLPSPKLGIAVNWLLDEVPEDADYYLNLESDVYIERGCLWHLIEAMNATGAPMACPMQFSPEGFADFIFWGAGTVSYPVFQTAERFAILRSQQRPKWCNLGCLLVRGDVARNPHLRVDTQFKLFCVDQDYTSSVAQVYGRPVYEPRAVVTHVGRQSTREGQPGGHTAHDAVRRINQKWAGYLAGGLFGP